MQDFPYGFLFLGLAFAYGVQLFLTGWQAKRYYKRLKELRKDGLTSVGMAGGKWTGRTYGVLVIDEDKKIVHAEKMSGMTIFSGLRPVEGLVGLDVAELLDENQDFLLKKKPLEAFRNAANEYFKPENQSKLPEKMSDIKSVKMYRENKV
ncbi:MAG: transcriptional regulator GutM [Anaerolineaceae bacterium]